VISLIKSSPLPARARVMILAPVVRDQKGEFRDVIERLAREGFVRARVDGGLVEVAGWCPHQTGSQGEAHH
jgi:excinuclease ABC subunit A